MTWTPKKLTRKQMEERRLIGGQLLKKGRLSQAEIACKLGVSRVAVNQWAQKMKSGGTRRLRLRKSPGRPPRLSKQQGQTLRRILKQGAVAAGFPTDRWTLLRIQKVIKREFGIHYHVNYLSRLLDRWGWSVQQPIARAKEQDEKAMAAWRQQAWPRIKKGTAERRNHRILR